MCWESARSARRHAHTSPTYVGARSLHNGNLGDSTMSEPPASAAPSCAPCRPSRGVRPGQVRWSGSLTWAVTVWSPPVSIKADACCPVPVGRLEWSEDLVWPSNGPKQLFTSRIVRSRVVGESCVAQCCPLPRVWRLIVPMDGHFLAPNGKHPSQSCDTNSSRWHYAGE